MGEVFVGTLRINMKLSNHLLHVTTFDFGVFPLAVGTKRETGERM